MTHHDDQREWIPFGDLLTELEKNGIKVDVEYLKKIEQTAIKDYDNKKNLFLQWASKYCPDAKYMNIESDPQVFLETSVFSYVFEETTTFICTVFK